MLLLVSYLSVTNVGTCDAPPSEGAVVLLLPAVLMEKLREVRQAGDAGHVEKANTSEYSENCFIKIVK